jgi:DNA-directed RNA polymerase subunit M
MFCEKCGSLLLPKDNKLVCKRCGATKEIADKKEFTLTKNREKKKKLLILEEDINTLPTTKAECRKCGNTEAEWWLLQTRKADEAETRFFRCTKCKFTWREYN